MPRLMPEDAVLNLDPIQVIANHSRREAITIFWQAGLYSRRDIATFFGLCHERIRQILVEIEQGNSQKKPIRRLEWLTMLQAASRLQCSSMILEGCIAECGIRMAPTTRGRGKQLIGPDSIMRLRGFIEKKVKRQCLACGRMFIPSRQGRVTCSTPCSKQYLSSRRYTAVDPFDEKTCPAWAKPNFQLAQAAVQKGERLLSVLDAAELLGMTNCAVYRFLRRGILSGKEVANGHKTNQGTDPIMIPKRQVVLLRKNHPRFRAIAPAA